MSSKMAESEAAIDSLTDDTNIYVCIIINMNG